MNAKKFDKRAAGGKVTGSREAVETAISISKGPRSATWDDIVKGDWGKIRQWETP